MAFSRRLPLASLVDLCRALRHYLGAGLTLRDVFRQQARKGSAPVRPVAERVSGRLDRGDDLETALGPEQASFPPLFLSLAAVGEQTGTLPEVFGELEHYFRTQQKLWRRFLGQITWPVVQFCAAVLVITGLIWILGAIADARGGPALDPLGLGLSGTAGAFTFLSVVLGLLLGLAAIYLVATRLLRQQAAVDALLLRLPVVGPCLHALALARFCLALRLTTDTTLPMPKAVRLSLRATGNAAFASRSAAVEKTLKGGNELSAALAKSGLFGQEFVGVVAVGEETGRLPEVMEQQAVYYEEEADRRLRLLAQAAAWGVWLLVAVLIIVAIFRIASVYLGALDAAGQGVF